MRKILEMSSNEFFIVGDFHKVWGFGKIKDFVEASHDQLSEKTIIINFNGKLDYSIHTIKFSKKNIETYNNKSQTVKWAYEEIMLFGIKNNKLYLNKREFPQDELNSQLRKVFKTHFIKKVSTESEINKQLLSIIGIISEVSNQNHGTMIVITDPDLAKDEVQRLSNQCITIDSFDLLDDDISDYKSTLINQLTKIDGAIYIDIEGRCHSLGVILDGEASEDGDSSRGARYNSALRYRNREIMRDKCVIVVISEDGMINVIGKKKVDSKKEINELKLKINEGSYDVVLKRINELIDDDEYNTEYYLIRADVYEKQEKFDNALEDYTKILNIKPYLDRVYNLRGITYFRKGEINAALKDFSEAFKINSAEEMYLNNRGYAYFRLDQIDLAQSDLLKAYEKKPNVVRYINNYVDILLKLEDYNKAIEVLNKGIVDNPKDLHLLKKRAKIYIDKGEHQEALNDFEQVLKLGGDDPIVSQEIEKLKSLL